MVDAMTRARVKPMRWCPGCQGLSRCSYDRQQQCRTVQEVEREMRRGFEADQKRMRDDLIGAGQAYSDRQGVLETDLRIAIDQGLQALGREKKLEARIVELLNSNSDEVERRRTVERDLLVQETIVAALADRCVLVERKIQRS